MVTYRAWLVDLDGTLYRPLGVKLAAALELTLGGPRAWSTIRAFRRTHERLRHELVDEVECPFTLQVDCTARDLGRPSEEVAAVVREWMQRRPGKWLRRFRRQNLLDEIAGFHSSGGKTALVSDYPALEKLAALGASQWFDTVVANGEPGGPRRLKPWPDGYLLAAERLGVPPQECLVIGDRPDADGEAAARAGMGFRLIR